MRSSSSFPSAALLLAALGLLSCDAKKSHAPATYTVTAAQPSAGPATLAEAKGAPWFHTNILDETRKNTAFRRVLFTGKREQLVVMSLPAGSDIGEEVHPNVEQVFSIVSGSGKATVGGVTSKLAPGDVLVVTPGLLHNIVSDGDHPLQLYTIYAPATHIDGRVHMTKEDAQADSADEQFGRAVR